MTRTDVRSIIGALDGTSEDPESFRFFVNDRQFVWTWLERVDPKKARVPNPEVIVARVGDELRKGMLIAEDPDGFFTEPHYDGYAAICIRLPRIGRARLRDILTESWELTRGA